MPKPANSRTPARKPPQPKVHRYIGALFGDDFGRFSTLSVDSANAFARKKLDRASQSLQLRSERQEKKAQRTEAREYRAAERGVQAELREADVRARMLFRKVRTKEPRDGIVRHKPPKNRQRLWPYAATALPKYDGPVLDRRGERGVFARFRYYSRRTAGQGVSQRVVRYVFNGAAIDDAGQPYQQSNVGQTIDETLCAFDHLEQVNWAGAKNAKIMTHGLFAVDHRQTPDEMMATGTRWAEETLGRFDLPYLVTLHAPPPDGDQRNWHLHILWSFRPMIRTGDHEWEVGEMLRTDLDNPAAMKVMREMYAAVMTQVSFETGHRQIYTAKSNADRGLPHEPQVHLGAGQTNRARSGHHVADNEANHERVMRSKAAVLDDDLRHADEALAREQRTLRATIGRWARQPIAPLRLPERYAAATFSGSLREIGVVPCAAPTPVIAPAMFPLSRAEPALVKPFRAEARQAGLRAMPQLPMPSALPSRPSQVTVPHFANLRTKPPSVATTRLQSLPAGPVRPAIRILSPSVPATGVALLASRRPLAQAPAIISASSLPGRPGPRPQARGMPVPGALPPGLASMPFSSADRIGQAARRAAVALDREQARQEEEQAAADRSRVQVAETEAAERRRVSLDRLLQAIVTERRRVTRAPDGRNLIDSALLGRFGLGGADLGSKPVQQRLAAISGRQDDEILRLETYARAAPQRLRSAGGRWTLDDDAPVELRALIDAWRGDGPLQLKLERLARKAMDASTDTGSVAKLTEVPAEPASPGSAWRQARMSRDRAMRAFDDAERLDGEGASRPGRQVERPGRSEPAAPSQSRGRPGRSVPVGPRPDIGR